MTEIRVGQLWLHSDTNGVPASLDIIVNIDDRDALDEQHTVTYNEHWFDIDDGRPPFVVTVTLSNFRRRISNGSYVLLEDVP